MKYEIMFIVRPNLEEGDLKAVVKNYEEVLTKKKALLASLIYQNEKIITFRGKNISVDLLVSFIDG